MSRYKNLLQLVNENYFKLDKDWRIYKEDVITHVHKTEETFNEVSIEDDVEVPAVIINDKWADKQMDIFADMIDKLEEALSKEKSIEEDKEVEKIDVDLLVVDIKAQFSTTEKQYFQNQR